MYFTFTKQTKKLVSFLLLIIFTSFCVFFTTNTLAQNTSSPFYWDYINVDIDVQNNGDMLITETQKYVFTKPHSNERYRYIPLDKVDKITDIGVFEDDKPLTAQTKIKNNQIWISWKHPLNPPQENIFKLKYRVIGGLHIYEQGDQVYWKAIFPNRSAMINKSTVTVKLPESLADKITSFKSFGVPTSSEQIDSRTVRYVATQVLKPQQQIEVQIIFPHGIIKTLLPNWQKRGNARNISSNKKTSSFLYLIVAIVFLTYSPVKLKL